MIFHLSYDFGEDEAEHSLNHHTPEDMCKVKYRDLDFAVRASLALRNEVLSSRGEETQDRNDIVLFYGKSDLRSAFKILPILPHQRRFLLFKAINPLTGDYVYFVEKTLPFGASVSCKKFQDFSDSLRHIMERTTGRQFMVTNYLDDFLFVGETELICNRMVRQFIALCEYINCPIAHEKTEWACSTSLFLGILMDGVNFRLALPIDKIRKAVDLLNWVISKKKVTIKFVQQLTGTLNFLNKAIVPGRAFTRGMYSKLKVCDDQGRKLKQFHHINLTSDFLQDCKTWLTFLDGANFKSEVLCRPYIDIDLYREAEDLMLYTDTSLSQKRGCGGIFKNRWFVMKWNAKFIREQQPSIEFLELYALVVGILTWRNQPELQNSRISVFCDNISVKLMVNDFASSCKHCCKLLRILALDGLRCNRRVFVRHVRTEINILADALSRLQFKRFWLSAPQTMNKYPDEVPEEIWPVEKIWFN